MKKYFYLVVLIVIIVFLGYIFVPGLMDSSESRNAAENVLDNLIKGNYEKAFDSVYYYDKASDLEPTISYIDAKNKWIERVKSLKTNGVYIVDYTQLRVELEDTYPVGSVNLVVMENGTEKIKEDVQLWFGKSEDGWKLGNLNYYKGDVDEDWEIALSGNMIESK